MKVTNVNALTVELFRNHFVAQQGKGPSPVVMERFQGVASQLMNQVCNIARIYALNTDPHMNHNVNSALSALAVQLMMTAATS